MRNLILCIFVIIVIIQSRGFAQTVSNSDFNPFPQMEQDQKSTDDDTAVVPQQQNDDWPPANNESAGQ